MSEVPLQAVRVKTEAERAATAAEREDGREHEEEAHLKGFCRKGKAVIWPWLSYMCQIRSTPNARGRCC